MSFALLGRGMAEALGYARMLGQTVGLKLLEHL